MLVSAFNLKVLVFSIRDTGSGAAGLEHGDAPECIVRVDQVAVFEFYSTQGLHLFVDLHLASFEVKPEIWVNHSKMSTYIQCSLAHRLTVFDWGERSMHM